MHDFVKYYTSNPPPRLPDLDDIGQVIFSRGYGKGAAGSTPNPYAPKCKEWARRKEFATSRKVFTSKIESLFEPRFITPPETSELIESIVTATDSRSILEVGMYSGFTSLHVLRAIVGKVGAKLTSIDCRPALDREFFAQFPDQFEFVEGWTPQIFSRLAGRKFDLVFVDSDHSVEHCEKERVELAKLTDPGSIWLFHDVPEWQTPTNRQWPPVRHWLNGLVISGFFYGNPLNTGEQLDCLAAWGPGYPKQSSPGLGIYVRR